MQLVSAQYNGFRQKNIYLSALWFKLADGTHLGCYTQCWHHQKRLFRESNYAIMSTFHGMALFLTVWQILKLSGFLISPDRTSWLVSVRDRLVPDGLKHFQTTITLGAYALRDMCREHYQSLRSSVSTYACDHLFSHHGLCSPTRHTIKCDFLFFSCKLFLLQRL